MRREKMIPVAVSGNKNGLIFDPTGDVCHIIANQAENWADIRDKRFVDFGIIQRNKDGKFRFVETSGYSRDRGQFIDVY